MSQSPVEFDHVGVSLGGQSIWNQATFAISEGEFVVVVGPNGAGKSTLLRLICGDLLPSEGSIQVLGQRPRLGNRLLGLVPQRRTLLADQSIRGRDLVTLGHHGFRWGLGRPSLETRQQMENAIEAVGASEFADEPFAILSGGQQQRLLIAQSLLPSLRLLLLDEPLASLDLRSQHEIVELIARLQREHQVTVLMVSHDLQPVLPVASRGLVVRRGRIDSRPARELTDPQLVADLYGMPVELLRNAQTTGLSDAPIDSAAASLPH